VTKYQYDGFGRIVAVWASTEDQSQLATATVLVSYQADRPNPVALFRVQIARRKDAGGGLFPRRSYEWRFYNGLGQLVQTQTDVDRSHTPIRAQDVNDLLSALSADGGSAPFAPVSAGATTIQAQHFTQLQASIQGRWTAAGLGTLPGWSSGVTPGGPSLSTTQTPIYGSDLVDLRQWLNLYELLQPATFHGWSNSAGTVRVVNQFYDGRGLLASQSVPHLMALNVPGQFNSGDWNPSTNPQTSYTYDALQRPLTRVQPDGTSTYRWLYSGFATTTIDENNHQTVATTDALGRSTTVQEYTGSYPSATVLNTTTYSYDVTDALTAVRDQAGNSWSIVYDSLGRKTSVTDPDLGTWTYSYPATPTTSNPLWLVQTQTDAKGQAISVQYDVLDRLTSKTGPGLAVGYGYDSGTNGIGRRTSLSDGAGTASYAYDRRGRLVNLTRTINGDSYPLATTYDAQDRVLSRTYPNGDVLAYVYGDHGLPVSASLNNAPLVTNATYNALKKLATLSLGNGLQTTWQYYGLDVQAGGRPANTWYGFPDQVQTGSLQNQSFTSYDAGGNPTGLSYADHTSESLSFAYNERDQLLGMSGSVNEGYGSYIQGGADDIGNLLAKGATTLSYGASQPHTPSSAGSVGYSYDANGNRQGDGANTYSYDAENRLTGLAGQVSLQNTFDGDGVRLIRTANGTTTVYVGDWYEVTNGVASAYYPFTGQPIALKQGSGLFYLHRDHLGSLVSVTNASGAEVGSARYWPFGGQRLSTGALPTDRLFTGQIRDLGDDRFSFFKARYYDATIGKFHTPDTIVPDPKNPQALNRYAYGLNNPLKFADPRGHYVEFVGGFGTDQSWDRSAFANIITQLQKQGMREGRDYSFFDWGTTQIGPVSLGQSASSMVRPVDSAAASLAGQIAGKAGITLVGHSKGGDVVLAYLAAVADGTLQANSQVHGAVVLNAPVGNLFASAARASTVTTSSLANLQTRLAKQGVNATIYDIYNPYDRVNTALDVQGITTLVRASGTNSFWNNWWFPAANSDHLATLADPFAADIVDGAVTTPSWNESPWP